ncbi:MAG TPA: copper resistance CopC family protein, partial [Geodermatophilus sp.]|nr:copper resistance CopC family protein [Geodermatophilus sp.]
MRRATALLVALVTGWLLINVVVAGPAAAHAELVSTDPAEGARLEQAPDTVTLRFSEPVSIGAGYARLLDADGTVQVSTASVDGDTLTITPRSDLPDDVGYLVTFRVVSADSHPIS